jgi:hypothetical protein
MGDVSRFRMSRFVVLLLLPLLGGCIIGSDKDSETVNVLAVNEDSDNIHIFADGEGFDPSNRIEPDDSRLVRVGGLDKVDYITFHAGRSGTILASVECQYLGGSPEDRNRERELVYAGGVLRCAGW